MRGTPWSRSRRFPGRFGFAIAAAVALVVAALFAWLEPAPAPVTGRPYVVDGDTLKLGAERIRLTGIDAPELDQTCTDRNGAAWPCGAEAEEFLQTLVVGHVLTCAGRGRDRYGRLLATCRDGDTDIAETIAAAGWATAEFNYAGAQLQARAAARGIWAGAFITPAEWRATHGEAPAGFWDTLRSWFG